MTVEATGPIQILIVDDDEVDRMALRRTLRDTRVPLEVTEAESAAAGLDRLRSTRFDCAILDYQMPGHDGGWLLRSARAERIRTPMIMLTGQGDEDVAVELMKAGALDYVPKASLSPRRLHHSLNHALRVTRAELEAEAAQRRLEESERRLRVALDAAQLGTWEVEPATGRVACDARCRALFELSETPTIEDFLVRIHADDRARVQDITTGARGEPTGQYAVEYRIVLPQGEQRWIGATAQILSDDGRERVIGAVRDITAQKRHEEETERQREFEQQLVGIVSHDLRNPVSAIMMGASVLLRREGTDERMLKPLARILSSGERAMRMIRDLLDFTRIRGGSGIPVERKPLDLHDVAHQVIEEVQLNYPERQIRFEASGDARGSFDADRLSQVLTNLVTNALGYGNPSSPVTVRTLGTADEVLVEVHNDGEPIPPDLIPVLFKPFARGTTVSAAQRSVGLGLYIVKEIVAAHHGRVEVQSTRERGTLFRIRLPRS